MKKWFLALSLTMSLLLTGCGTLIPKKVEFFQDKVHQYPELTVSQKETQKETAQRAKESAEKVLVTAVAESASTNLVQSAADTAVLTDAVAESVGEPKSPSTAPAEKLATKLKTALAKHDRKVESFKQDNNENTGKKIEGTGFLQIPYFVYVGLIALVVFVGWHLAHTALSVAQVAGVANPAVGAGATVGLGAMNVTSALAGKAVSQMAKGGELFKEWLKKETQLAPGQVEKILDAFRTSHQQVQDQDVQEVVKTVTK
jgi:hypothetical protein